MAPSEGGTGLDVLEGKSQKGQRKGLREDGSLWNTFRALLKCP